MQTKLMHTNTLTGNECSHKYVTIYILYMYKYQDKWWVFWIYTANFLEELHIEKLNIPEFPAVMTKPLLIISLKLKIKTYANSLQFKQILYKS